MLYYANNYWKPVDDNPFALDGSYGEQWSAFIYDESINNIYTNVYPGAKIYTFTVNPEYDTAFEKLFDFINYETSYLRNVILKIPNKVEAIVAQKVTNNLESKNNVIRSSDTKWMVHSTTKQLWNEIKVTGALLSPNNLRNKGKEITEIGLKSLLEPADYSDYVMLHVLNGCGEIVVNSRQLGYVCLDLNMNYTPGVRIYFDAHKIIKDGIATRDGLHPIKVYEKLSLDKYMVMVIDETMLPKQSWTPTIFTQAANEYFLGNIAKKRF